jgi:tRNA(Ile)-lysidine synthase
MASSRKRRPTPDPAEQTLLDALRAALSRAQTALPRPAADEPALSSPARRRGRASPVMIAFSGGRDSAALLDAAVRLRDARAPGWRDLVAVHIHHGLQKRADAWVAHCEAFCAAHKVPYATRRVTVQARGRGLEAAAREARYAALAEAAHARGVQFVLTAHHQDDRIETFLIQWLRGAGPDGLAAFPAARAFADGSLQLVRPFIDVPRSAIESYVRRFALDYIDDPTNDDPTLLRNALRALVLPRLDEARPGFRKAAARSVELVAEAADVLREVAAADLEACTEDAPEAMLRLDRLGALPAGRQALVLRAWLAKQGVEAPPRARLLEALQQARHARADARLLLRIGHYELRRYRGLLLLRPDEAAPAAETVSLRWRGESEIVVPRWRGTLHFVATEREGFPPEWLQSAPLQLKARSGGERFKPHPTRPSKTLKRLFQDAAIPEFERGRLPLVWRGDQLIYVAGLGADVRLLDDEESPRVLLDWRPDPTLLEG